MIRNHWKCCDSRSIHLTRHNDGQRPAIGDRRRRHEGGERKRGHNRARGSSMRLRPAGSYSKAAQVRLSNEYKPIACQIISTAHGATKRCQQAGMRHHSHIDAIGDIGQEASMDKNRTERDSRPTRRSCVNIAIVRRPSCTCTEGHNDSQRHSQHVMTKPSVRCALPDDTASNRPLLVCGLLVDCREFLGHGVQRL